MKDGSPRLLALAIRAYGAETLIVSGEWGAHKDDPLSRLTVTTDAYRRIGEMREPHWVCRTRGGNHPPL